MAIWEVTNTYKYTMTAEIEAPTKEEAEAKARYHEGFERNHDDIWYDQDLIVKHK